LRYRLHDAARAELARAAQRYEFQLAGLGVDLVAEVEHTLETIADNPRAYPRVPGFRRVVRRALVARFPFAIIYVTLPSEWVVLAIAHGRRRPGYWRRRAVRT
jgi:toxin ParE1/3/4